MHRSVSSGTVMMENGAISGAINWFTHVQKVTTAASSESEHMALSEMVNKLRFFRQVKGFMAPPVYENIKIYEDNE